MTLVTIGLWVTVIYLINFVSLNFLKQMNASEEHRDAYSPFVLKVAKFPPCGFTIVLFLVLFGFLLQLIEFIFNKKL